MRRDRLAITIYCLALALAASACNLTLFSATVSEDNKGNQPLSTATTSSSDSSPTPEIAVTSYATPPASIQANASKPCTAQTTWPTYVVVRGDTLNSIAQRAATSAQDLATANCLANVNLISVGQTLYVPMSIASNVARPVAPGNTDQQPHIGSLTISSSVVSQNDRTYHINPNSNLTLHVNDIRNLAKIEFVISNNNGRAQQSIATINNPGSAVDQAYISRERAGSDLLIMADGYGLNGQIVQAGPIAITVDGDPTGFQVGALSVSPATMQNGNVNDLLVAPDSTVTLTLMVHDAGAVSFFSGTSINEVTSGGQKSIGYVRDTQDSDRAQLQFPVPSTAGTVIYIQASAYSVFASAMSKQSQIIKLTVNGTSP